MLTVLSCEFSLKTEHMRTTNQISLTLAQRRQRHFSEGFRQAKVKELEAGLVTVSELCRTYQCSYSTVYRWIAKFGTNSPKPERLIMENLSDTQQLLALKQRVAELERTIGQKQLIIDFKDKMIELAEEHYQVDIKKKFSTTPSFSSAKNGKNKGE
jgi:transposase-like protein